MQANGSAIRALRKAHRIGIRGLADSVGVHRAYLSRLERGQRGATDETVVRIAQALAVPIEAITRDAA
jgi:transcriptional regulator with XRE-family HTH domain